MAEIILNRQEYRDKVLACWLGKNIGGTLGAPFEWMRQTNNVTFYTQKLTGEPLPNDDLDIQLLWLIALENHGVDVDAKTLADYWCYYVTPHWSEYGNAKINMRRGLVPPICGSIFNDHKHSCGSFIRTEIWACIAPGLPRLAAQYAYQDAILDHGDGEGTYASVFIAALESAAFVNSDLRQLIDIGLSYIPTQCGVAAAVRTTVDAFDKGLTWREARDEILRHHRGKYKANDAADREKGFETGALGYDVPSNIGITILGLLYGGDNFDKMICTTVNCGEDTDCTGATAGSIFGIMRGTEAIPQKWIDPIGRGIKTIAINCGDLQGLPCEELRGGTADRAAGDRAVPGAVPVGDEVHGRGPGGLPAMPEAACRASQAGADNEPVGTAVWREPSPGESYPALLRRTSGDETGLRHDVGRVT